MSSFLTDPDQSYFSSRFASSLSKSPGRDSSLRASYSSPMTSSAFKNKNYDGISYIPMTPIHGTADRSSAQATPHSATSVISAFRELQAKSKVIEQERALAVCQRDELRMQLNERRRTAVNSRSQIEMDATEKLLNQRASNERMRHEHGDMSAKVNAEEDIHRSLQRGTTAQRALIASLQDDVARNHARIHSLESATLLQQHELETINARTRQVSNAAYAHSPEKNRGQYALLHETVDELERKIEKTENSRLRAQAKARALTTYIDLIIRINGELVETIVAREQTRARILRLQGKVGPRYTWPKQVPYTEILGLVNEAAVATAANMVETDAIRASESAVKSILRAVSPGPVGKSTFKRSDFWHTSYDKDRDRSAHTSTHPSPGSNAFAHSVLSDDSGDDDDDDDDDAHANGNGNGTGLSSTYNSIKAQQQQRRHSSPLRSNLQNSRYTDRSVSFLDAERYRPSEAESFTASMISNALARSGRTKTTKRRKTKGGATKKTRKSVDGSALHNDSSRVDVSALTSKSIRQNSIDTVIARQGAITNATRFAAAATAAASTGSVQNTPTSLRSRSASGERPSPGSAMDSTIHADTVQSEGLHRAVFVPSGNQGREFNIVASVSKANRAVKKLNATVASRVKSLHSNGAGDIFDELPRVNLHDMQQSLDAFKKLNMY